MQSIVAQNFFEQLKNGLDLLMVSIVNIISIALVYAMAAGGKQIWIAMALTFFVLVLADELLPDYCGSPNLPQWYMELQLQLALPMLLVATLIGLNATAPTPLHLVDNLLLSLGFDAAASRGQTNCLVIFFAVGFIYGTLGITAAHELCHRTSFASQMAARWLLAFSWDTGFAIEHIHGHHKNVGIEQDPATARRDESLLRYLSRSIVGQIRDALLIERRRLSKLGMKRSILANKFYRGQLMSLAILFLYIGCLGWINGTLMCFFAAAIGKFLHAITSYIEHYGLVRIPGRPIEERHSWDCHKRISCRLLFNLPLHADHHQFSSRRYYDLRAIRKSAPMMPFGYMVMFLVAFFPPIWKRLIHPRLADWDRNLASAEELRYLESRNPKARARA